MIRDLDHLPPADRDLACDVCVVGTGAAGLAVATELLASGLRVVVAEGGGAGDEAASQRLYDAEVVGPPDGLPFAGHATGRFRTLGGATTRWGGQAYPLTPIDFEPRDWVALSGWPIGRAALDPYYPRAERFMGADDSDLVAGTGGGGGGDLGYGSALRARLGAAAIAGDGDDLEQHFTKWSRQPDLRRVYRPALEASATTTVLLHANLTRIDLSPAGDAVRRLHLRSLGGAAATVAARAVVLCTGAIEAARVLLANDRQIPGGIGNGSDWVGRCFQDHPTADVGTLVADAPARLQRLLNLYLSGPRKYAVRLSTTDRFQRRHHVLNASGVFRFDAPAGGGYHAVQAAYARLRGRAGDRPGGLLTDLARAAAAVPALAPIAYHRFVRRRAYTPGATVVVAAMTEQEPSPDSRITLSAERDALGTPLPRIRWRPTDLTGRTLRAFALAARDQLRSAGVGRLDLAPWLRADDGRGEGDGNGNGGGANADGPAIDWRPHVRDQLHHIGTARMSDRPADGVVDPRCRVHGVDNLYVAGSAVFPTSGHSNPTLTLIALSIRVADDLRAALGR